MAENVNSEDDKLLNDIKTLLWGNTVKEDVFKRWAQGFYFSPDEPTALIQAEGGPCAVIAPIQAFILKQLLAESEISTWRTVTSERAYQLLVKAAVEIVQQTGKEKIQKYYLVYEDDSGKDDRTEAEGENRNETQEQEEKRSVDWNLESDVFHSRLRISTVNTADETEQFFLNNLEMLKGRHGILLLLYSIIATKGIPEIRLEMSDPQESMIDPTYGYGNQSLINLMLTGRAVSHVWDHDQNIGGLKLQGIDKQNSVGFLALLEHLRYCEVGNFLKSPSHPVWILGSETHLSVLFSTSRKLVSPETPAEQAKRVFRKFDPEEYNFIPTNQLQEILDELGLVADTEYVEIMKKKLDSENLGVILLGMFMEEFFPEEPRTCPDTFPLFHYNGLQRSNLEKKVTYHRGQAVLLECTIKGILESNPMLTVLQTKWPRIEIQWDMGQSPSLN